MRRPSSSVSAEVPRAALTIAGVTGGAILPDDAQPPTANTNAAEAAKEINDRQCMDDRCGPGLEVEAGDHADLGIGFARDLGQLEQRGRRDEEAIEAHGGIRAGINHRILRFLPLRNLDLVQ